MSKMVFTYHRVGRMCSDYNNSCVSALNFEKQICYLKKVFDILPMDEFIKYSGTKPVATITFDDGYKNTMETVLPIVSSYNVPITVFVTCACRPDHELWMSDIIRLVYEGEYDDSTILFEINNTTLGISVKDITERCGAYQYFRRLFQKCSKECRDSILLELHKQAKIAWAGRLDYCPLTQENILELSNNELVTLGAHSINHVSLARFSEEEQRREIECSISILQQSTGKKIRYFAYPFGNREDYNDETIRILKENEILAAFTTRENKIDVMDNMYTLPRFNCTNDDISTWADRIECVLKKVERKAENYCGIKNNDRIIEKAGKIIICGCGKNLEKIIAFLKTKCLQENVIAIVDSDENKQNTLIYGYLIRAYEDFYDDKTIHWIINNRYDYEIFTKLVDNNVKNIHWWIDL